ncbi:AMP-binding protein [Rhizobiales bacterium]|uniref:AMP-binding protein n=1 Tax=Hongsoonwoonella zoysiae TaxID=2821844 RepID=UPI00155FCD44|nr:AMP-binding protein [Hongsoonwoonella zoysiae]NRG17199.1 AMP-binding protein [Hongsoonwoonella zoysiae]
MSYVGAPIAEHARRPADETALACGNDSLTWSDLEATVEVIARQAAGKAPAGARVVLDLKDPSDILVSLIATARTGQAAILPDPNWREGLMNALKRVADAAIEPQDIEKSDKSDHLLHPEPKPEDAFYIGFTSGSTGYPKAFRRSHRSWLASFKAAEDAFGLSPQDRIMVPGGMSHSLHLFAAVHGLHLGATVHLVKKFSPRGVLATMMERKCTTLYATPTQMQLLCRAALAEGLEIPALKRILISGSKVNEKSRGVILDAFRGSEVFEFYGTSETSFVACRASKEVIPAGSAGRIMAGVEAEVRRDDGAKCQAGETGVIWVKSDQLFDGYEFGEDSETRFEDGWLTVGDCGWFDAEGYLFVNGRRKRMLVSAGVNVFAEEIERVLESLPGIEAAAAFGIDDELRGTRIVAVVSTKSETSEGELRRACLQQLPSIKVPRRIFTVADWPLTPGGKSDLLQLKVLATERDAGS